MKGRILTSEAIDCFKKYLREEEKSENTIEKYLRDVRAFITYLNGAEVTKETVVSYKDKLLSENYAARSVNSMVASLNSLFSFLGWADCKVKSIKLQRQIGPMSIKVDRQTARLDRYSSSAFGIV